MLKDFKKFIKDHHLIKKTDKILVAMSGGPDSVCLLHLMSQLNISGLGVAHVNHNTRREASDGDEAFAKSMAQKYKVDFHVFQLDPKAVKGNFQAEARNIRYQWFAELSRKFHYTKIATAHHLDDQIENFFLKINRGGHLASISGIPLRRENIIRPLLFCKKEDILNYLNEVHLNFRTDASNESDKYDRNYIRLHVLPLIKDRFPNFESNLLETMKRINELQEINNYLKESYAHQYKAKINDKIILDLSKLKNIPHLDQFLYYELSPYGATLTQIQNILNAKTGGEINLSDHDVLKDRNHLVIKPKTDYNEKFSYVIERPGKFLLPNNKLLRIEEAKTKEKHKTSIYIKSENLIYPLQIRHRKDGDIFYPEGMNGKSKKLKKYLTDLKLSKYQKDEVLLLTDGHDDIIWVIGHRQDSRFTSNKEKDSLLRISIE